MKEFFEFIGFLLLLLLSAVGLGVLVALTKAVAGV